MSSNSQLRKDYQVLFAFGDRHAPHHEKRLDNVLLDLIQDIRPDIILDGGDFISADSLSVYPKTLDQMGGLQDDLDEDYRWRTQINSYVPTAAKLILKDNHFFRRLEDQKRQNPWFENLRALQADSLLKLTELKWEMITEYFWRQTLMFIHGDEKNGLYNASTRNPVNKVRNMVKDVSVSMVRFHSHVTGIEMHRQNKETRFAIQLGCFIDFDQVDYIKHPTLTNWTHSAGVFYLPRELKSTEFLFVPILFTGNKAAFNGKIYS